jgi:AcrR family transcriptional regulator
MSPRTGRRPGQSGTKEKVLNGARASFTQNGYDGATIRDLARRAKVDPGLVHHYYGNKQTLFVAAVRVPVDPTMMIDSIARGDPLAAGERIAHTFLET